ncbi:MAG: dihydrofolate reductase family protein, partial [Mucilaginibacter sp.]
MRNVIYGINVSIDGCCDHTKFGPDEETFEFFTNLMKEADLIVYGRKTYELMVPYWPDVAKAGSERKVELDFAEAFTAIDKVVFSKTLQSADENTRIVRDNLEEE